MMAALIKISRVYMTCMMVLSLAFPRVETRTKREIPELQYSDCGNEDKIIHFHHLDASPIPIVIPGTIYVTMSGNLTSDLPRRVNIYLGIKKYFFGFPFTVPCLSTGVGSCAYENICASLEQFETTGCPKALRSFGFPCHCPILEGDFSVLDIPFNIPKIQGFATALVNGEYELELRIAEEDGPELGCLQVKFSVRKRNRGWLFKI